MTWDLGPRERRAFLAAVLADDIGNDSIIRRAMGRRDIAAVTDILARLLAAELAGQPDALAALPERLLPRGNGKSARKGSWPGPHDHDAQQDLLTALLATQPDYLLPEYGQGGREDRKMAPPRQAPDGVEHWLRTMTCNRERNRRRKEKRHRRIERERKAELASRYKGGAAESAERVYLRIWEGQDIRRRIMRLPEKLATVAMLLYEEYSAVEIGRELGIPASTVRSRVQSIRSPRIRQALGF